MVDYTATFLHMSGVIIEFKSALTLVRKQPFEYIHTPFVPSSDEAAGKCLSLSLKSFVFSRSRHETGSNEDVFFLLESQRQEESPRMPLFE